MVAIDSVASSSELENEDATSTSVTRRRLILRDSLTFLSLTLLSIALFAVTFFLFRSFAAHRTELGRRWSDRGRVALVAGRPEQAIAALRTALSYAPGVRAYELLLAQALAQAGHTDEAYNYFTGLWDSEPGNGFINLQLARLAATRNERQEASNFYRSALYGTWEGDGVVRRREVRLELVRYLLKNKEVSAARAELLVAAGNADDDPVIDLDLGRLFQQAGDRPDALDSYLKAVEGSPGSPQPLAAAGRLAFSMGDFATAQRLLYQATRVLNTASATVPPDDADLPDLLKKSERLLELFPSPKLSSGQRVTRLLVLKGIARKRLDACAALPTGLPSALQQISDQWLASGRSTTRSALLRDQSRQDELLQLIYETEARADGPCGSPSGDDALLVLLSRHPKVVER